MYNYKPLSHSGIALVLKSKSLRDFYFAIRCESRTPGPSGHPGSIPGRGV